MMLTEAITLFRRLGINVEKMSKDDFRLCCMALVRRYHPDYGQGHHELMANINCATTTQSYRRSDR